MALPSSGPISGSQISAELGTASTNISLGGMADSASFLEPNAYSDFYGYANLTSFLASLFQSGTKFICGQTQNATFYHNGSNTWPGVGDTVYTNSGGTTFGVGYSRVNFGYILTNSSGVVTNQYLCGP
ncbi:hypothetical protein N9923_00815 [bacterium]|nr:hypothetical protein [bacterium]